MKKTIQVIIISMLFIGCSDDSSIDKPNPNTTEDSKSERFIKDIMYDDSSDRGSHYYYENNQLSKSSVLNSANYEVYSYNSNGKIEFITQYYDSSNNPNNSNGLDFNYENNFNDTENITEYDWLNVNSFIRNNKQYNFDNEGLVQSVECLNSDCATKNIYYKNNQIDKIIYNEGKSSQHIYTFEFDEGINPMNTLFRKFGYVEYINVQVFDFFFDFYYINNTTKIYRDGELEYTASYQYNDDNYPIQVSYHKISNGETGTAVFTYN